jgi:hypothetical protein
MELDGALGLANDALVAFRKTESQRGDVDSADVSVIKRGTRGAQS